MASWLQLALTSVTTVLASSGLWAYVQHKDSRKDATTRLMMGLAYDKVTTLGISYINRGWVTRDELEEFQKYFFEPYKALGGNGVAERIMLEVQTLPFRPHSKYAEIFRNRERERFIDNVRIVSRPQQPEESTSE